MSLSSSSSSTLSGYLSYSPLSCLLNFILSSHSSSSSESVQASTRAASRLIRSTRLSRQFGRLHASLLIHHSYASSALRQHASSTANIKYNWHIRHTPGTATRTSMVNELEKCYSSISRESSFYWQSRGYGSAILPVASVSDAPPFTIL